MKRHLPLLTVFFCFLIFAIQPPAFAQNAKELTSELKKEKQAAESKKKKLKNLSRKVTRLKRTVSREEERIAKLSKTIAKHEKEYLAINAKRKTLNSKYNQLVEQNKVVQKEVIALVKKLWPLYINTRTLSANATEHWDELDRRYTWASRMYNNLDSKQRILKEQETELKKILDSQTALTSKAQKKLSAVNTQKDELLKEKLKHRKQLKKVTAQKHSAEASLRNVLSIIENLNYKIEAQNKSGANFSLLKGVLPWPAQGIITKRFAPRGKPPVRGIGLALENGSIISAVSGGKVVHNDVLRGFGRVVILMHGEEYYTLYAFLADSSLKVGDYVKQKQMIGEAGFYPAVDGPGVYFELRFHQKAINPETWLSALK